MMASHGMLCGTNQAIQTKLIGLDATELVTQGQNILLSPVQRRLRSRNDLVGLSDKFRFHQRGQTIHRLGTLIPTEPTVNG